MIISQPTKMIALHAQRRINTLMFADVRIALPGRFSVNLPMIVLIVEEINTTLMIMMLVSPVLAMRNITVPQRNVNLAERRINIMTPTQIHALHVQIPLISMTNQKESVFHVAMVMTTLTPQITSVKLALHSNIMIKIQESVLLVLQETLITLQAKISALLVKILTNTLVG